MAFDVVMPQMGESITEATILKWHRQVGEAIGKDETLYEISTDKVDAEIPAPIAGTLLEILVEANATVPVGTVVARHRRRGREAGGRAPSGRPGRAGHAGHASRSGRAGRAASPGPTGQPRPRPRTPHPTATPWRSGSRPGPARWCGAWPRSTASTWRAVRGTGLMGRVTKEDMEAYLASRAPRPPRRAPSARPRPAPRARPGAPRGRAGRAGQGRAHEPHAQADQRQHGRLQAHQRPRVHGVRDGHEQRVPAAQPAPRRPSRQAYGTKLSFMPFTLMAVGQGPARLPRGQRRAGRRQHRLQAGHQPGRRGGPGLGPHRPGDPRTPTS